ncbi:MAG: hypothetical protein ACNA8R_11480 [Nitriliruptoraceae bacterium]
MTRPAPDGFWRQRARGVASLVLLAALTVAVASLIAWLTLVVVP